MTNKALMASICALALFSSPVFANDWAGAYIGVTGGYAMGESNFTGTGFLVPSEEYPNREGTIDVEGSLFGAQVGFNFDLGNGMMGGIVADYSHASLDGSVCADDDDCAGVDPGHTYAEASADWLSTVRGKLGIASEESFVYLTGGLAMSNVTSTVTNLSGADSFDLSEEADMTGWTAGAGMNFKVAENVDMGIEYLYVDLGQAEYDYEWPIPVTGGAEGDLTMHVVRASINYHF